MSDKIKIAFRHDWPAKFGGAWISAFVELTQKDDCESGFCGNPNLTLMYWSADNLIRLTLGDDDDMDMAKLYYPQNAAEAMLVFHELMCFLESIADTVVDPEELWNRANDGSLYPKIDGVKMMWEWEE